ncbi:DUF1501 domain-containing protein [Parvularcula marina]|uniref:DUF1501 domain-containing protein n=1 Tax=Parvularcula marina TaxID=2292771 RepID=A0A371RGD5_9PROT|nr:DUF1501 domain-containing protein [Parvularcula marina]RFB04508.1 DUF1501 domain-containing protein [Parvularcula marina]
MTKNISPSRRRFLQMMGRTGSFGAAAPMLTSLVAGSAASAQSGHDDYRAIVCIFLFGGNDCHNTVIPLDEHHYNLYNSARAAVAVDRNDLFDKEIVVSGSWGGGRRFAFNPQLGGLHTLFNRGQLGLVMNVGSLIAPVTAQDVQNEHNLPPKLFSHNDQFTFWQSMAVEGAKSGWGGRLGELLGGSNTNAPLMTMVSTAGQSTFTQGRDLSASLVNSTGPVAVDTFNGSDGFASLTLENLLQVTPMRLGAELTRQTQLALASEELVTSTLNGVPAKLVQGASNNGNGNGAVSDLHEQLNMVARIIAGRHNTGVGRQIFFCSLGGFDAHGNLTTVHPGLLHDLGDAMLSFQNAVDAMGATQNVTTFTASDFGRALTTNGRGSDHGWGGHHFVMGGCVKSFSWAGAAPTFEPGGPDDAGQGRLIPNISVDQYAAAISRWMGASPSDLADVAPRIGNFDDITLDLFTPDAIIA